jgi:hypothetical protein
MILYSPKPSRHVLQKQKIAPIAPNSQSASNDSFTGKIISDKLNLGAANML